MRLETQKQTLIARDESIKKLLEMLQNKGMGKLNWRIHSVKQLFNSIECESIFIQVIFMCKQQLLVFTRFFFVFLILILYMFVFVLWFSQIGKEEERAMFQQMQAMAQKQVNNSQTLLIQLTI